MENIALVKMCERPVLRAPWSRYRLLHVVQLAIVQREKASHRIIPALAAGLGSGRRMRDRPRKPRIAER